jgi:hypothetical protein
MNSKYGWLALAAFIVAWDVACEDQLSHGFRRAPKPVTIAICTVVVAHLYEVLPKRYDPIHLLLSKNSHAADYA